MNRLGRSWFSRWRIRYERRRDATLARPWAGRIASAYGRYYDLRMQHVAGAMAYYGALTLFPSLGLLYAVLAHLVRSSPHLRSQVNRTLAAGLGVNVDIGANLFAVAAKGTEKAAVTTLGVVGVVYAGLLAVDACRRALRLVWIPGESAPTGDARLARELVRKCTRDVVALMAIAAAVVLLVGLAAFGTGGPYRVLATHGLRLPGWTVATVRLGALAATVAWASVLCGGLYHRLGGAPRDDQVRRAALLSGGFLAALVVSGLLLLKHAFADPIFGISVATLGLMLWVSTAARVLLSLAIWAAAGSPVSPRKPH